MLGIMKPVLLIVSSFLLVLLTGCIVLPAPASGNKVASGKRIQPDDVAFVHVGQTTREEFESKLGPPWTNYSDLRVSVYWWEMVTGHWVWGAFLPGEISIGGGGIEDVTRMDVLFVKFDENDRVERLKIMHHPRNKTTKEAADAWLKSP